MTRAARRPTPARAAATAKPSGGKGSRPRRAARLTGRAAPSIHIKRVYDDAAPADGFRVLVDRLWPRGVSRDRARLDAWARDIAPSTALRKWYKHDPERWDEFKRRYRAELAGNPGLDELRELLRGQPVVTLLYGARTGELNHAVVLREALTAGPGTRQPRANR